MTIYSVKPARFLHQLIESKDAGMDRLAYCAGFEFSQWRCEPLASHLIEWIPEFALNDAELTVNHGDLYKKLRQAAHRIYTTPKYQKRGEAGEIALHAICRDFFETIPISHRVFYKSTANDVIKAFDMVHVRFDPNGAMEIWLGESKLYTDGAGAVAEAISSVREHLDQGFLKAQKFILGPQIPKATPHYEMVRKVFEEETSLDDLISTAVFSIGIFCDSDAVAQAGARDAVYESAVTKELEKLSGSLAKADFGHKIRVYLIYIPLLSKDGLIDEFDAKLKALQ